MINRLPAIRLIFVSAILLAASTTSFAQTTVVWEDSFTNGVPATPQQQADWTTFRGQLLPALNYQAMRISGSLGNPGLTCNDPVATAQYAALLNTLTSGTVSCDGHDWSLCGSRYDGEVWIDPPSLCSGSNCPNPGRIIRPGINNLNWGGVGTATCDAPSQTMRLEFSETSFAPRPPAVPVPTLSGWALALLVTLFGFAVFHRIRNRV